MSQTDEIRQQIMHSANPALPVASRITVGDLPPGEPDARPPVQASFLVRGEWTGPHDWWRLVHDRNYRPAMLDSDHLTDAARQEIEDRGWQLLARLGYVPEGWEAA